MPLDGQLGGQQLCELEDRLEEISRQGIRQIRQGRTGSANLLTNSGATQAMPASGVPSLDGMPASGVPSLNGMPPSGVSSLDGSVAKAKLAALRARVLAKQASHSQPQEECLQPGSSATAKSRA